MNQQDLLQFRFVPTMRCNLKCPYCFLPNARGDEPTMFDEIPPARWVEAMKQYRAYEVEFYLWGGEPFLLDGTYDLVNGFLELDFVRWCRIDTNMTFVKKILRRCADSRIKLNCSWHTHVFDFEQIWKHVLLLAETDMVGMVNFVASDENMEFLKKQNLDLDDLVKRFYEKGIFLNVAAEFQKGDDPAYRDIILKYMSQVDWDYIHNHHPSKGAPCDAAETFFTVDIKNGDLTTCGLMEKRLLRKPRPVVVGNFFSGKLKRHGIQPCPQEGCLSIVSYCHRQDNNLISKRHLDEYVKRNIEHRRSIGTI